MYLRYVIRLNRSPAQYKVEQNESKHRICHSPNNNILTIKINGSTNSYTRVYQHSCNTIDMYDIDCCADNAIGVGYKICCQVCYRSLHHSIQPILESGDLQLSVVNESDYLITVLLWFQFKVLERFYGSRSI